MKSITFVAFVGLASLISMRSIWKYVRGPIYYEQPAIQSAVTNLVQDGSPEAFFVLGRFYQSTNDVLKINKYKLLSEKFNAEACKNEVIKRYVKLLETTPNDGSELEIPEVLINWMKRSENLLVKCVYHSLQPQKLNRYGSLILRNIKELENLGCPFAFFISSDGPSDREKLKELAATGYDLAQYRLACQCINEFDLKTAQILLTKLDRAGSDAARTQLEEGCRLTPKHPCILWSRISRIWNTYF